MKIKDKTLIVIGGPTAVGKTSTAISLAQKLDGEIISADSRQMYREMTIGTAKPSEAELSSVPHHFIDTLSIFDTYSAGQYGEDCDRTIAEIFSRKNVAILCGGSGLYINAVLNGMDSFPEVSADAKSEVSHLYQTQGCQGLVNRLTALDPDYVQEVDTQNHRRLMRALEVSISSGKPFSSFRQKKVKTHNYLIRKFWLSLMREDLHRHINDRVDQMLESGLLDEVKALYPHKGLRPLETVGYQEYFDYLDGKYSLDEATAKVKTNTRRYAKRQCTWFSNQYAGVEISTDELEANTISSNILNLLEYWNARI